MCVFKIKLFVVIKIVAAYDERDVTICEQLLTRASEFNKIFVYALHCAFSVFHLSCYKEIVIITCDANNHSKQILGSMNLFMFIGIRCQFHQRSTYSFYVHRAQKRKKRQWSCKSFYTFGNYARKSCTKNVDEIDPRTSICAWRSKWTRGKT